METCTITRHPSLSSVKPNFKRPLATSEHTLEFESCFSHSTSLPLLDLVTIAEDSIFYVDGVISTEECENLCRLIKNHRELRFWSDAGRNDVDAKRFRDADTIEIVSEIISQIIWDRTKHIFQHERFEKQMGPEHCNGNDDDWERDMVGRWCPCNCNKDMLLAKYPCGGSFAPHTDGRAVASFNERSFYSIIIFLNDIPNDSGGGTKFYATAATNNLKVEFDGDDKDHQGRWACDKSFLLHEVYPKSGRMLVFDQRIVHEGVPARSPFEKYIIRSDVMLERVPPICNSSDDLDAYEVYRNAEDLAGWGQIDEAIILFKQAFRKSPLLAELLGQ